MTSIPLFLERLGLGESPTERDVKRAYAQRLKKIDQVANPDAFVALRSDYDAALNFAKSAVHVEADNPEFSISKPDNESTEPSSSVKEKIEKSFRQTESEASQKSPGWVEEFRVLVLSLDSTEVHAIEDVLVQVLRQDHLIPFVARTQFEKVLLECLTLGDFELHSGAVLLAANSVFNWHSGKGDHLETTHGDTGAYVNRMLESYSSLTASAKILWLRRTRQPTLDLIRELQAAHGNIEFLKTELAEFFYTKGHLARWQVFIGEALRKAPSAKELAEKFRVEVLNLSSSEVSPIQLVLKRFQGALLSPKEGIEFEETLAERLALGDFGLHSGATLVACGVTFSWLDGGRTLAGLSDTGAYIKRLLDDVASLTEDEQKFWLRRTLEPGQFSVKEIAGFKNFAKKKRPELAEFFYPKNHLSKWQAYFSKYRGFVPAALVKKWKERIAPAWPLFQLIGFVVVIVTIASMVINSSEERQKNLRLTRCDVGYAKAVEKDWKGLLVSDLTSLKTCATDVFPPLLCTDRDALLDKLAKLNQLQISTSGHEYAINDNVMIDLPDGRSFGLRPDAYCGDAWRVAESMRWLESGDEVAAKALLKRLAVCQPNGSVAPNYVRILRQIDAWPDQSESEAKRTIPLKSLLVPSKPVQKAVSIQSGQHMPACMGTPPLQAPDHGYELAAIQNRALIQKSTSGER